MLPKTSGYITCSNEAKYMSFLTEDEQLQKSCNKEWDKISNIIQKWLYREQVFNEWIAMNEASP